MKIGQGTRTDLGDDINDVKAAKGTSRAYTLSRLKRERPDLFAQVVAGKLSANKAAIRAGFRKKPSPYEAALGAALRLPLECQRDLWQILGQKLGL
jgi:hypothetical protein